MDLGYETDARKPQIGPKPRYHYIINVILSGKVVFCANPSEKPVTVHGGQMFATYPTDSSLFKPLYDEPLEQFFIGFDAKNDEIIRYLGFTKSNPVREFTNVKQIARNFNKLIDCWHKSNKDKFVFLMNFYKLLQTLRSDSSIIDTEKSNFKDIFSIALQYMEENLSRNMTINELTDYLKIDRSYFTKIFKKQFNYTPYKYYMRIKFLKAQTMLTSTNYTVTEISEKLGFSDVSTFSQAFTHYFKKRPSAYRQTIRKTDNDKNAKINDAVTIPPRH